MSSSNRDNLKRYAAVEADAKPSDAPQFVKRHSAENPRHTARSCSAYAYVNNLAPKQLHRELLVKGVLQCFPPSTCLARYLRQYSSISELVELKQLAVVYRGPGSAKLHEVAD
jgi:hypothetical protein